LDQDDLLIFKNKAKQAPVVEKKKPEKLQQAATPPKVPFWRAQKKPAPPKIQPQPEPQAPVRQEPIILTPTPTPQASAPAEQEFYVEQPQAETIYTEPEPVQQAPQLEESHTAAPYGSKKSKTKEMRKAAENLACELHPWRKAYAICDFCKRPFCYEDIAEHNGTFYCIDDIDRVPESVKATRVESYNSISLLSVFCYVAMLAVFSYTSYPQVNSFVQQMIAAQTFNNPIYIVFLNNLLLSTGILVSILSFLAGAMVLIESKRSFIFATAVSVLGGLFFLYTYLATTFLFYAVYAGVEFLAIILLAYSRTYYEAAPTGIDTIGTIDADLGVRTA